MKIDQTTVTGATILFIFTTIFFSFIAITTNPNFLQGDDKKVNKLKAISVSVAISFLFTALMSYISIQADKKNLLKVKKM